MQFDKFTIKAQEAVQGMRGITQQKGHQQIEVEHLLLVLLEQSEGVIIPLLEKLGIDPAQLKQKLTRELDKKPTVHGGG